LKNIAGISRCDKKFQYYTDWLKSGNVEYIVLDYRKNNFDDIKKCSSLLLTGGDDIFPEFYNDWEDGKDRSDYKPERDGFEFKLLDYALNNNLPVLGICRGLQLINSRLNGSLINDIETVRGTIHTKISENNDRMHDVNLFENSLVYDTIREKRGLVNSSHHQAIDRLGEGLVITAKTDDGIIEAVEWEEKLSKPFLLAIQWHPERMKEQNSPFTKNVLLRFKQETENN
jgi:putative glutamine amidotransferase